MIVWKGVPDDNLELYKTCRSVEDIIELKKMLGGFHRVGCVDVKMEIVDRHVFDPSSEDRYGKPCVCVGVIQIESFPKKGIRCGNVAPGCIDMQKDIESIKPVIESWERHLSEKRWNEVSENKGHDFGRRFCNGCIIESKSNLMIFILITMKHIQSSTYLGIHIGLIHRFHETCRWHWCNMGIVLFFVVHVRCYNKYNTSNIPGFL